jgi:hypothetical protein
VQKLFLSVRSSSKFSLLSSQNKFLCARFAVPHGGKGVYLHPYHNWFLSAAHKESDIEQVYGKLREVVLCEL